MKRTTKIINLLVVVALAFSGACKSSEDDPVDEQKSQETVAVTKATETMRAAARDVKDYTYAQKAEFVGVMQQELADIQKEKDRISARVEQSNDAAKAEARAKLEALDQKRARVEEQLGQIENSTESTWDDVKGGFIVSYEEMMDAFQQTRQWLSERVAP